MAPLEWHSDSLVQDCGISIVSAMEIPQSCIKPSDDRYLNATELSIKMITTCVRGNLGQDAHAKNPDVYFNNQWMKLSETDLWPCSSNS